jgi:hypothetical protein
MTAVTGSLLVASLLHPQPKAIEYSLEAGRCSERVPIGATEAHSVLAVGASARLSTIYMFSRGCGGHGNPLSCSATPLEVKGTGGVAVHSVRGTTVEIVARAPGKGQVAIRARRKRFPALTVKTAVPAALAARASSYVIDFPLRRILRVAQGGVATVWLVPVDEGGQPLCAGGKLPAKAPALRFSGGAAWEMAVPGEIRAVEGPGSYRIDLALDPGKLSMPVEIVSTKGIRRLELEPHLTQTGPLRIAVRSYDEADEVLGTPVRLWLSGDGALYRLGHFDQPLQDLETTDAEVAVVPGHPGASFILSARTESGAVQRLEFPK